MHDILSEICKSYPDRWDKYVQAACWIKRITPDPALPSSMTTFQVLSGRSPRTSLDTPVAQIDNTEETGGLDKLRQATQADGGRAPRHPCQDPRETRGNGEATRQKLNTTV